MNEGISGALPAFLIVAVILLGLWALIRAGSKAVGQFIGEPVATEGNIAAKESASVAPDLANYTIERLQNDITRPEVERRSELISRLVKQGKLIERQEAGLVTVKQPKSGFSMGIFIVLLLLWIVPGVLYLIACAFSRDKVEQYVLLQA